LINSFNINLKLHVTFVHDNQSQHDPASMIKPVASHHRGPSSIPWQSGGICGRQSGIGTGCAPSTTVFPVSYHTTNAPQS